MTHYFDLIVEGSAGNRCDMTPLFADTAAFTQLLDDLVALTAGLVFDLVAAIDALGFIVGSGLAARTGRGLVAVRKAGKLPAPVASVRFKDYTVTEKQLEVRADSNWVGQRMILVDEWIETGAQMRAATSLLRSKGATVVAIVAVHCDDNEQTRSLETEVPVFALRRGG